MDQSSKSESRGASFRGGVEIKFKFEMEKSKCAKHGSDLGGSMPCFGMDPGTSEETLDGVGDHEGQLRCDGPAAALGRDGENDGLALRRE